MPPDDIAVLVVESDARLAELVARYLEGFSIHVTTLHDESGVAEELAARSYTCVIWISMFDVVTAMREACDRAGVPLLRVVPASAREILARVLAVAGKPANA